MSCKTYARRVTMSTALEIERKYIIRIPNEALLRLMNSYTESLITQTYLCPSPGETRRVRRREYADHTVFTKTTKRRVDGISSIECEDVITESEYLSLLHEIEPGTHPIEKKRKTFLCNGTVFEIDIYPEWKNICILETELEHPDDRPLPPDFIEILAEVTGEKRLSNHSLSRAFPDEDIIYDTFCRRV